METRAGGVREHIQTVKLGFAWVRFLSEGFILIPVLLPLGFYGRWVVVRAHEGSLI